LSTIRAYVGSEGLYSKGQKNATFYLAQYADSHAEEDFDRYLSAIAVPEGDRQARVALQQSVPDEEAARRALLQAGNHPDDITSMIRTFRWFGRIGPMKSAIEIWAEGDAYTQRLAELGRQLRHLSGTAASSGQQAAIRAELADINQHLTPLEDSFSSTLSEAARLARTVLLLCMTLTTILTAVLCVRVMRAGMSERDRYERGMARVTQLYAALSQTGQLIVRVGTTGELFDEMCRISVNFGGLGLAAVARIEPGTQSGEFL